MISQFLNRLSLPQNGQLWRPCKTRAVERLGDKKCALIYKRLLNVRLCLQREASRPAKAHKLVLPEKKNHFHCRKIKRRSTITLYPCWSKCCSSWFETFQKFYKCNFQVWFPGACVDLSNGQFSERCDVDGSFFNSDAIPIIFGKA